MGGGRFAGPALITDKLKTSMLIDRNFPPGKHTDRDGTTFFFGRDGATKRPGGLFLLGRNVARASVAAGVEGGGGRGEQNRPPNPPVCLS